MSEVNSCLFRRSKAGHSGGVQKQWYSKGRLLLSSIVSVTQSQKQLDIKSLSISGQLILYFCAIAIITFSYEVPGSKSNNFSDRGKMSIVLLAT